MFCSVAYKKTRLGSFSQFTRPHLPSNWRIYRCVLTIAQSNRRKQSRDQWTCKWQLRSEWLLHHGYDPIYRKYPWEIVRCRVGYILVIRSVYLSNLIHFGCRLQPISDDYGILIHYLHSNLFWNIINYNFKVNTTYICQKNRHYNSQFDGSS